MFCKCCGSQLDDNAAICPKCGVQVGELKSNLKSGQFEWNIFAILGFVLSFFSFLAGLVCSILGYKKTENGAFPYKKFALAGIIISSVSFGLTLLGAIIYGASFISLMF